MAPKKVEEVSTQNRLLGRNSGRLSMGLVGLPNCGKSTTFNVLTKLDVVVANRPFATIDPNKAVVSVPEPRIERLTEIVKPEKVTLASLEVVDIAGLVRNAHKGEGLGNAFLSNIHSVDGIYHVVRVFEDEMIAHVEGDVDPVRDLEIISEELRMKDLSLMQGRLEAHRAKHRHNSYLKVPALAAERKALEKVVEILEEGTDVNSYNDWTDSEIDFLNEQHLLTAKPVVYLLNMSKRDYIRKKNKHLPRIVKWIKERNGANTAIIPYCAELELELVRSSPEQAKSTLEAFGTVSMLDKVIQTGYDSLHLMYYFTMGKKEVRCWTCRKGSNAPKAAGVIHTDFEKTFCSAEVFTYEDVNELGSENNVKGAGRVRTVGKDYVVQDGDIMFFKCAAAKGGRKR